ncbi:sensor histidine kinase RegB [Amaricoccus solimangrovi]|uniref:histidine kinase n=1 Tax=Amaricoccus solimangrovi TaxID=2589815 RepID=A0A501WZW6_9RHOB|nr:ActS/PrrB/RegB family redox-sensitive histidine kinase [Amaricoccus solimangrovi]TPE52741.1 ActS/PrrB/RegB family redox-sensitive histidine kinase [Amaricoccus solimangrovi]
MEHRDTPLVAKDARSSWLRARTLLLLRWLTILGQTAAVIGASAFGVEIPLRACLAVIAAAVLVNGIAMAATTQNRRLSAREAMVTLMFDIIQLGALLALTGGLNNPFALMMIAPVMISASVLSLRATAIIAVAAVVVATLLAFAAIPLRFHERVLADPPLLVLGNWVSLVIGIGFFAFYARRVNDETFRMSQALAATQAALGREQKLTMLSGVVAAAAHELGTPLATIKLLSAELAEELEAPEQREDALLIRAQADRCAEILRSMGPRGYADTIMSYAPVSSVVEEAAAPHANRGIRIITRVQGGLPEESAAPQPELARQPEIIQGLRNLVQNAVDFATSTVWIDIDWTPGMIAIEIGDDGPGYPPEVLRRIGVPFVRSRGAQKERPGYEGMGLGLFIAKTLLERSGARLSFGNAAPRAPAGEGEAEPPEFGRPSGAVISVTWSPEEVTRPAAFRAEPREGTAEPEMWG